MSTVIGKIFLVPKNSCEAFLEMPPKNLAVALRNLSWHANQLKIQGNQFVLVVDTNGSPTKNHLFYCVIAREGLCWIHNYDLIHVDQTNGNPIAK